MAAKKIRVYDLAKEIGIDNKATLDLCISLGIDVKSHSSSIEDAQADRVRNKAKSSGLYQTVSVPAELKTTKPKGTKVLDDKKSDPKVAKRSPGKSDTGKSDTGKSEVEKTSDKRDNNNLAKKPVNANEEKTAEKKRPAKSNTVVKTEKKGDSQLSPEFLLQSSESDGKTDTKNILGESDNSEDLNRAKSKAEATEIGDGQRSARGPANPPDVTSGRAPLKPPQPLLSSSTGKPIPPPPRQILSSTGKPIPPPPPPKGVFRNATAPNSSASGGAPKKFNSSSVGQRSRFAPKPSTRGEGVKPDSRNSGVSRPAIRPDQIIPAAKTGASGRRIQKKVTHRRRRNVDELEPTRISVYSPSTTPVPEGEIIIERSSTAQEIAPKLNRSSGDIIRFLLLHGEMITATQTLSDDMIELFAAEIGARIKLVDVGQEQEATLVAKYFSDLEETDHSRLVERPPVITVMGHVDHGKTKLLDRIRNANVVAGEAGGITQHIGAYQVEINSKYLTFIDTPGHEAFSAMRARGAKITDIVVLVVAADDGVMPQTVEAIEHAKAAEVPILVAINKIDRPDADIQRVMQQISEHGLLPEAWGGDTVVVEISALNGQGIPELLENLILLAEINELKADPTSRCRSIVLESNLDVGRGPVATVIVQSGRLRVGDSIIAGSAWGKIKALINDRGDTVKEALPSTPVQVLGLSEPPLAGSEMIVTTNISDARTIGELREKRNRMASNAANANSVPGAKLEDIFDQISKGETATLNIVLKADVQGSLEAITQSLKKLEREDVKISIVQRGVGGITESDVNRAVVSNATIVGFNVRPDRRSRELAEVNNIQIRTYEIIYKVIEDMEKALLGLLKPEYEEIITGEAEVLEVFRVPKVGAIAGCIVRNGAITRGSKVRFLREGVIIWKGTIVSLKRFKDDAREVSAGFECGIGLSDFQDLKSGDVIETFDEKEIERV